MGEWQTSCVGMAFLVTRHTILRDHNAMYHILQDRMYLEQTTTWLYWSLSRIVNTLLNKQ
jgi:hypothetical protein